MKMFYVWFNPLIIAKASHQASASHLCEISRCCCQTMTYPIKVFSCWCNLFMITKASRQAIVSHWAKPVAISSNSDIVDENVLCLMQPVNTRQSQSPSQRQSLCQGLKTKWVPLGAHWAPVLHDTVAILAQGLHMSKRKLDPWAPSDPWACTDSRHLMRKSTFSTKMGRLPPPPQ